MNPNRDDSALRARFHCPIPWNDHKLTDRGSRRCLECGQSVHFVTTAEELEQRGQRSECVVAPEDLVNEFYRVRSLAEAESKQAIKGPRCLGSMKGKRGKLEVLQHYPEALPAMAQRPCFLFMIEEDQRALQADQRTVILLELYPSHQNMVDALKAQLGVKEIEQQFISAPHLKRLYQERGKLFPEESYRNGVADFFGQ